MGQQRGRRQLGDAGWRELLSRFDEGDETVQAFCQREGVSKSAFHRRRSLRGLACEAAPAMVQADRGAAQRRGGFVELGALCGSSTKAPRLELTLDLGGGVTLSVVRG